MEVATTALDHEVDGSDKSAPGCRECILRCKGYKTCRIFYLVRKILVSSHDRVSVALHTFFWQER